MPPQNDGAMTGHDRASSNPAIWRHFGKSMTDVDEIRNLIRAGATVFMGFAGGRRVWWIEHPYVEVDDEDFERISIGPNGGPLLVEAGDSLFGWEGNSQTWRSVYAE